MKMPFLLISPKIVPKIQLIKKGGCFEYHAVIADKIEYRYIHRASICPASGMDRRSFFMPKTMGKYKRLEVFHLSKPVYTADKPSDCHLPRVLICSALRIERLCWNKKRPASAGLNYIESLSLKKPLKFLIMLVEKSILKWYIKQTKMVSKDISASAREWIGFPIISYHEKLHRGICLHLQRPPKIESLANFEPIGRCKIPMKMLMKLDTR